MKHAARATIDQTSCPANEHGVPHQGGPLRNADPVCLVSDGQQIVRLGDYAVCHPPAGWDVVIEGAATFTVCGIPVARQDDKTVHGGHIGPGSPHFMVGGPKFKMPKNFTLRGRTTFANKTIRDIYKLSTTKSGKELLDRLEKSNQPIVIRDWVNGQNGMTVPDSWPAAHAGTPTGSTVWYNPDYSPIVASTTGHVLSQPPTIVLGHELTHSLDFSEGTSAFGTDPAAPPSEPFMLMVEAEAIGVGTMIGRVPSENSIRADLKLPPRGNHLHYQPIALLRPHPIDLRPGDCEP